MIQILAVMCLASALQTPVTFVTIARSDQSGIERQREVTVRTAEEWQALWKEHQPDEPPPRLDFSKSIVIGVFLGFRNTGGYSVAITSIERAGDEIVVTWKESRPGPQDITSQVLTFPFHIVRIERLDGKVVFKQAGR
jgi:hypothetical protein